MPKETTRTRRDRGTPRPATGGTGLTIVVAGVEDRWVAICAESPDRTEAGSTSDEARRRLVRKLRENPPPPASNAEVIVQQVTMTLTTYELAKMCERVAQANPSWTGSQIGGAILDFSGQPLGKSTVNNYLRMLRVLAPDLLRGWEVDELPFLHLLDVAAITDHEKQRVALNLRQQRG